MNPRRPGRKTAAFAALLIILSLFPAFRVGGVPGQDYFVKGYATDYAGNGVWNATVSVYVNGHIKCTYKTMYEEVGYTGYYKVNVGQGADIFNGAPILVNVVYQGVFTGSATGSVDHVFAYQNVNVKMPALQVIPENLTAANSGDDIVLNWSPPNCEFDNYSIYISDGPDGFDFGTPDVKEDNPAASSWAHAGQAASDTNYYYIVRSVWDGFEEHNRHKASRYGVPLHSGWNLVASPRQLTYTRVGSMANDIDNGVPGTVDRVVRWTTTGWSSWLSPIPWVNNYTIQEGECYFVYINGAGGMWHPPGTLHASNVELTLHRGWNPIALPRHGASTLLAGDVISQIDAEHGAGTATSLSNWTGAAWDTYAGEPADDFALDDTLHPSIANGRGWFLRVEKNVVWTPG